MPTRPHKGTSVASRSNPCQPTSTLPMQGITGSHQRTTSLLGGAAAVALVAGAEPVIAADLTGATGVTRRHLDEKPQTFDCDLNLMIQTTPISYHLNVVDAFEAGKDTEGNRRNENTELKTCYAAGKSTPHPAFTHAVLQKMQALT